MEGVISGRGEASDPEFAQVEGDGVVGGEGGNVVVRAHADEESLGVFDVLGGDFPGSAVRKEDGGVWFAGQDVKDPDGDGGDDDP